ncbi:hypothetical protein D1872_237160 [compost metagenome]
MLAVYIVKHIAVRFFVEAGILPFQILIRELSEQIGGIAVFPGFLIEHIAQHSPVQLIFRRRSGNQHLLVVQQKNLGLINRFGRRYGGSPFALGRIIKHGLSGIIAILPDQLRVVEAEVLGETRPGPVLRLERVLLLVLQEHERQPVFVQNSADERGSVVFQAHRKDRDRLVVLKAAVNFAHTDRSRRKQIGVIEIRYLQLPVLHLGQIERIPYRFPRHNQPAAPRISPRAHSPGDVHR